jgi:hypothetical protein
VAPDARRRLSEGALVEASVRARVLGIPLLKLHATVVLVPAAPTVPSSAAPRSRARAAGGGLVEAVRSLDEGAELLAEVRRNGA